MRRKTLIYVLAAVLACSLATLVYASSPPITLNDGYEIITNYQGVDVAPGTPVTATAMTLNPNVTQVTFLWKNPGNGRVHGCCSSIHKRNTR